MKPPWDDETGLRHARRLFDSHRLWIGADLVPSTNDDRELALRLFEASFVLVSHGTEADPVLNYGNGTALALWEMEWAEFTRTPSRFTAEAPNREERARLLTGVTQNGFIANYTGVRVTRSGCRFRITQATVWNLLGDDNDHAGQAAMFSRWEFL